MANMISLVRSSQLPSSKMAGSDDVDVGLMSADEFRAMMAKAKRQARKALRTEWRTGCSEKDKSESLHQALYSGGGGGKKYSWMDTVSLTLNTSFTLAASCPHSLQPLTRVPMPLLRETLN
ncbi:hypothetical protein F5X96DRAFT_612942 [Biscogniauxia mediterranea]|nr:hypothetical protein F5X96DRAFT_612942 [Biscogniauxia mediterranea]